jgi:GTP-binding protein EngB required for normal cell division
VFTKIDKLSASERGQLVARARTLFGARRSGPILLSGETGEGVPALWQAIFQAAAPRPEAEPPAEAP